MNNSTTAVTETGLNALDTARLQYNRVALMERQTKNSVKPPIGTTDVAGLGLNALDTICIVPRLPEPNGKLRIRDLRVEPGGQVRSEEHTSELQSPCNLVCRLLLEKKKKK